MNVTVHQLFTGVKKVHGVAEKCFSDSCGLISRN